MVVPVLFTQTGVYEKYYFRNNSQEPEISAGHRTLSGAKLPLTSSTLHSAGHRDLCVNLCIFNISIFIFAFSRLYNILRPLLVLVF